MAVVVEQLPPVDVVRASIWGFRHGYLDILLRGSPLLKRTERLAAGRTCFAKLLLLCPLDGELAEPGTLHPRLRLLGNADELELSVAGSRRRRYGGHAVYELASEAGAEGGGQLLAAEQVASIRTIRVVAEAMARGGRQLPGSDVKPGGDAKRLASRFVEMLNEAIQRDAALREAFVVVAYDSADPAEPAAAVEAVLAGRSPPVGGAPASLIPPPGDVGAFSAWSFLHGYLLLVAGQRDLATLLSNIAAPLAIDKVVIVCPLWPGWTNAVAAARETDPDISDISALDASLAPVSDLAGVGSGEPGLAGRSFGSVSVYAGDGGRFALEVATPLRTLRLGMAAERRAPAVYTREAAEFVRELKSLLDEQPAATRQFEVLPLEEGEQLHAALRRLESFRDRPPAAPTSAQGGDASSYNCSVV